MADVFSKKCRGCNAILSLRESCKACADKARARLHAEGVASSEEREIPHLSMWGGKRKRGTWAEDEGRPPLAERQRRMFGDGHAMEPPPAPHGFQLHGLRGARFGAVGSLDEWAAGGLEAWTRSQSYEPPPVGAEVAWEVAECHMRRDEKARYSAKRSYRSEYAIREGRLVLCDAKDGDWWPVSAVPSGGWVRLA